MIKISADALLTIKNALKSNTEKHPRIILKSGGCAGHMLVLTLDAVQNGDIEVLSNGITFVAEPATEPYLEHITIYQRPGLTNEILIRNDSPLYTKCRCGKSFKI